MVRVVFELANGERQPVEADENGSLMQAAVTAGVEGIDADCGGSMVCGTCHVYVPQEWQAKLPDQSEVESEILDYVPVPHPDARLGCQIPMTPELEGLTVKLPETQR